MIGNYNSAPWQLDPNASWIVRDKNGDRIASVALGHNQCEENADLIAASPDLLATLKSIASNTCCDACREAALVAQAALDKLDQRGYVFCPHPDVYDAGQCCGGHCLK